MTNNTYQIGNLVTCKIGDQIFNADVIGMTNTMNGRTYIVRDYAVGRKKSLGDDQIQSHGIPIRFKGITDWRYIDGGFMSKYDGVTRPPPKIYDEENTKTLPKAHCKECELANKRLADRLSGNSDSGI